MRKAVWFILIFLLTIDIVGAQTTPREYFRVAKYKLDNNDFQSALDFINSAIISDSTYMNAYLLRAEINFHLGYFNSTINDIDKAFSLDPQEGKYMSKYYLLRGQAYRMINKKYAASKDIEITLSLENRNAEAYYERAMLHNQEGKYREALHDMNKAIEIHADIPEYYSYRANIKQTLFNPLPGTPSFESMLADINVAIALDPDKYEYYKFRFRLMKEEKLKTNILINELNIIIAHFPDQTNMYIERGMINLNNYLYKNAIRDFTQAIELNDTQANAYRFRGLCYHNINKPAKAIQDFSTTISIIEDNLINEYNNTKHVTVLADTYIQRGYSYQISNLNHEACKDFLRAYNLGSKNGLNYYKKFCRGF